ncbi:hypothetical protein DSECCO2_654390 [anaerobic digester metagenome]
MQDPVHSGSRVIRINSDPQPAERDLLAVDDGLTPSVRGFDAENQKGLISARARERSSGFRKEPERFTVPADELGERVASRGYRIEKAHGGVVQAEFELEPGAVLKVGRIAMGYFGEPQSLTLSHES